MSQLATAVSRVILRQPVSDPMSGFFMLQRKVLDATVHDLSGLGFKILLDILATVKQPLSIAEVPYQFRERFAGESKLDELVIWEYGMLLADKTLGRFVPVRFLTFSLIGGLGVFIHMAVLIVGLRGLTLGFTTAQSAATGIAMMCNFVLNNLLTYRDRRLRGWAWCKGLVSFMLACSIGGDVRRTDMRQRVRDAIILGIGLGTAVAAAQLIQIALMDGLFGEKAPSLGLIPIIGLAGAACGAVIGFMVPYACRSNIVTPLDPIVVRALRYLVGQAETKLGSKEVANNWVFTPNNELGGITPAEAV